jgi:hypothetical protein
MSEECLPREWFVRSHIHDAIMEEVDLIADVVIQAGVDYATELDTLLDYIEIFIDCWQEFTAEELEECINLIQTKCALFTMVEDGLLVMNNDGSYSETELGKSLGVQLGRRT